MAITLGSNPLDPTSTFAVRVSGSGQANTGTEFSYAQLTGWLNAISDTQIGTVDASQYTGIQFYAIINTGATGARLMVGTLYTDLSGGMCTITPGGEGLLRPPGRAARDHDRVDEVPGPVRQPDADRVRKPEPAGRRFPKREILHLKRDLGIPMNGPIAPWELWIDDLTFY